MSVLVPPTPQSIFVTVVSLTLSPSSKKDLKDVDVRSPQKFSHMTSGLSLGLGPEGRQDGSTSKVLLLSSVSVCPFLVVSTISDTVPSPQFIVVLVETLTLSRFSKKFLVELDVREPQKFSHSSGASFSCVRRIASV